MPPFPSLLPAIRHTRRPLPRPAQMKRSPRPAVAAECTQLGSLVSLSLFASLLVSSSPVRPALSADLPPDDCAPTDCGNNRPNVSYPFWIEGRQPSHCGYPAFKLTCDEDAPVIYVYREAYLVRNIFYNNKSFIVSSIELSSSNCPVPRYNLSLGVTPFSIDPSNRNLSFFLNCTGTAPGDTIGCAAGGEGRRSFVGEFPNPGAEKAAAPNCESVVVLPSLGEATAGSYDGYSALLERGFLLNWDAVDCGECSASGGRCRYNATASRFACLCSDRPHGFRCNGTVTPVSSDHKKKKKIIIGLCAGLGGFFLASFLAFLLYRHKKLKARSGSSTLLFRTASSEPSFKKDPEIGSTHYPTHVFQYEELKEATGGFSASNELGDGGFGVVYKGKLRDGRVVAVKRLYESNYKRVEQFLNEMAILSGLRHQNLVTLYGCTDRRSRELLLVYEFVPNGTVADHLHGHRASEGVLTWPVRLSIAVETAAALAYLHAVEPQIIHRDVKSHNILLDNNFHVKVADFGLSRLFPLDVTHVSTAPQGTPGYVDPDYHQCYQLTDKSDVYSFGVVLVELISSLPAVDITRHRHEINLANMAVNKIQGGALHELVDLALGFETDGEVKRMVRLVAELAFRCLQGEKEMRPSMGDVADVLLGIRDGGRDPAHRARETMTGMGDVADVPQAIRDGGRDPADRPREEDHGTAPADELSLLKTNVPPSPDSVMDKWTSRTTTPNASG